tara:strand:+ start:1272 stop:2162 length:891 start_codon:yes stop_codon:yes gene_type:complete
MRAANLFCIGCPKSGTTTLFKILCQHSQIHTPKFKEPFFFNNSNYQNGIDWYANTYYDDIKNEKWILDFTPSYLYSDEALFRINEYSKGKDLKFIVMLRNPVERAYSHYLHTLRDGLEDLDFNDAIQAESERLLNYENNLLSQLKYSYIYQSLYHKHLSKYFESFGRNNFFVINYDSQLLDKSEFKLMISDLQNFLEIKIENLNIEIKENSASESRFKILQTLVNSNGLHKRLARLLFKSKINRQILINKFRKLNEKKMVKKDLEAEFKKNLYDKYFHTDVLKLESLLEKKLNWND